jgi:hypothetical protein
MDSSPLTQHFYRFLEQKDPLAGWLQFATKQTSGAAAIGASSGHHFRTSGVDHLG